MREKSEFRNATNGQVGVIVIEPGGKERGIAVPPGGTIWLSEDEQVLTANAPRRDTDNPFTNGTLQLLTEASEVANRRPIGTQPGPRAATAGDPEQPSQQGEAQPADRRADEDRKRAEAEAQRQAKARKQAEQGARPAEETGAAVSPQGTPKVGKRAPAEEVGTPEAAS